MIWLKIKDNPADSRKKWYNEAMLLQSFLVIVPILMFGLSSLSLLLTIKFQTDSRKIDAKRAQRTALQNYAEKLIASARDFINAQAQYLEERLKLEADRKDSREITAARSSYVYDLKDRVAQKELEMQMALEMLHVEISNTDFPRVLTLVEEIAKRIRIQTMIIGNKDFPELQQADIANFRLSTDKEIASLIDLFARTQDHLSDEINNINLYKDLTQRFARNSAKTAKALIDPLFVSADKDKKE